MRSTPVKTSITCRRAFDPVWQATSAAQPATGRATPASWTWRELHPRTYCRSLLDFYRDPLSWVALFVSTVILAYVGGLVMFWVHAGMLGELGPAISPTAHWILDSTLGFIGLGPAVAMIMPFALRYASAPRPRSMTTEERLRPLAYALLGGGLFTMATVPGPIMHDLLVGRGTWLANQVTVLLGGAPSAVTPAEVSEVASIGSQVLVGLPTYIALVWLSLVAVRALVRARRSRSGAGAAERRDALKQMASLDA
jgi:hypothetical protein